MVEQKNINIEAAEAEKATFAMLAAFYNINPENSFLRMLTELNPGEIEDVEVKALVEQIIAGGNNSEPLLELKRDWTRLFRGVAPDYGPVPPYAQQYTDERKLNILSELAAIYSKYGFTGYALNSDRHDYIGSLLDFAAHISGKRVEALKAEDDAEYSALTEMLEDFIGKYISSWFGRFCVEAAKYSNTNFYKSVMRLTMLII